MNILIQAVLRSAIAEYLYLNTARKVLIDEYVNITGSFFTVKETNFVNATLDKITKTLESNTKAT
jgi:transcription termination factor NusB